MNMVKARETPGADFGSPNEEADRWAQLSRREAQVAELAVYGLTNAEIAARLAISVRTVDGHMANAIAKLSAGSRREVGQIARRLGLVPPLPDDESRTRDKNR